MRGTDKDTGVAQDSGDGAAPSKGKESVTLIMPAAAMLVLL